MGTQTDPPGRYIFKAVDLKFNLHIGNLTIDRTSKPAGTAQKLLDVSKINRLGWKEKISMEEGMKLVYGKYSS